MVECMDNPEMDVHVPISTLARSKMAGSCMLVVLDDISHCNPEWTEIGADDKTGLNNIHDPILHSWV